MGKVPIIISTFFYCRLDIQNADWSLQVVAQGSDLTAALLLNNLTRTKKEAGNWKLFTVFGLGKAPAIGPAALGLTSCRYDVPVGGMDCTVLYCT